MSIRSIPRPSKLSEAQFVGDLISLLNRHRVRSGDPQNIEKFASDLASKDALRSDLFTLCTAISHMGEVDLSGEQLLVLVARALAGPGIADGTIEIPESMRSAFLTGFEAWSKRDLDEPLPWPAPRQAADRSEPLAPSQPHNAVSEAIASQVQSPVLRALAKDRDIEEKPPPIAPPPQRSSPPGTHSEGLTLNELRMLLEDIEHRMNRIEPQLEKMTSIAHSSADYFERLEKLHESEMVDLSNRVVSATGPGAPLAAPAEAAPVAPLETPAAASVEPLTPEAIVAAYVAALKPDAGSESASSKLDDEAFLARHAYLNPPRRPEPPPPRVSSRAAAQAAAGQAPAPANPGEAPAAARPAASGPRYVTVRPRGLRKAVLLIAALVGIVSASTGIFVYRLIHADSSLDDAGFTTPGDPSQPSQPETSHAAPQPAGKQTAQSGTDARVTPSSQKPGSEASPTAADTHAASRQPPQTSRNSAKKPSPAPGARSINQQQAPISIWPPSNGETSRGATPTAAPSVVASAASTAPRLAGIVNATPPTHLTAQPNRPLYVPSATMIGNALSAPKPIYPTDRAKAMDGTVVLQVTISKAGNVTNTRAVSGPAEMRPAAVQAVRAWRFKPYLLNGYPVEVITTLEFSFKGQ